MKVPEACLASLVHALEGSNGAAQCLQLASMVSDPLTQSLPSPGRQQRQQAVPHHRTGKLHPDPAHRDTILAEAEFCGYLPQNAARWEPCYCLVHGQVR